MAAPNDNYPVEEVDVIPDDTIFDVVPDWPAPEGTEATYLNAGTFRRYKMVDGTWRQIGTDPAAADAFDLFSQFVDLIHWNSIDGYTTDFTYNYGAATAYGSELIIGTANGNPSGGQIWFYPTNSYENFIQTGKAVTVEWSAADITTSSGQQDIHLIAAGTLVLPTLTGHHFGFHIKDNRVFTTNADGTTRVETDTGVDVTLLQAYMSRLRAVFTPGTDIKFYINDVLVKTETGNLPGNGGMKLLFGVSTGNIASEQIVLNRVLVTKQY